MWESLPPRTQPERYFSPNQKPGKPIKLLLKAQKAFTDTHEYFSRHFSIGHMLWSMLIFQFYLLTPSCLHCCPNLNGLPPLQWRWDSHIDSKPSSDPRSEARLSESSGARIHVRTFREMGSWNVWITCPPESMSASSLPPSANNLVFHVGLLLGREWAGHIEA